MYPNRLSEKRQLLINWIARMYRLWCMVFTRQPEERKRGYNLPMSSVWSGILVLAIFLVVLISLLYWLLTTLAG